MKIYIDVSKIKIFQMELLENFMAKNDIEYARIYTIESIDERDKEIERLNKQIKEYQKALDETTSEKINLENIIKEVREYIEEAQERDEDKESCSLYIPKLLEILDKGE